MGHRLSTVDICSRIDTFNIGLTSLVAQMIKNLPVMQETRVWSLSLEGPLEKGMATQSSILAWRIPRTEATVHGVTKSWTRLSEEQFDFHATNEPLVERRCSSVSSLLPRPDRWCFILKLSTVVGIHLLGLLLILKVRIDLFPLWRLCFSIICQHIVWQVSTDPGMTGTEIVLTSPSGVVDLTCEITPSGFPPLAT